ncbi:MAG: SCP2 sterol-binding domain-containing protein [Deltaproteobacteria bacterium]|nr:SCP2 sterol-binding domain-containing protein [Deltaproteobacteria bacterium]
MSLTIDAPEGVEIAAFFDDLVPPAVRQLVDTRPLRGMHDVTFRVRFSVEGVGDWLVSVVNATRVAVKRDRKTPAHLTVRFDEASFRRSQTGEARRINVLEMLYGDRKRFDRLLGVKGMLQVELDDHGEFRRLALIFNETQDPAAILRVGYDDFCDILDKIAYPPMLLLRGRMRIDGNVALLLRVQGLL